ncbi:DgyrCDS10457 [Dimorphilus gyrociliatus]|uniref:Kinase n=1 Tax=Dimorphilus gyrociliatus TaxID=2664684 RepID=A0A7I8W5D9_9ANNE|nr:DgyrCDS10457 [Dimorphilus gyrociliatus]
MDNGITLPADVQILSHQIAGHRFQKDENGGIKSGLLQKDKYVLKPLQSPPRGEVEVKFYRTIFDLSIINPVHEELRNLVPPFYGTEEYIINGTNITYLKLLDIAKPFRKPCIMDIKIGKKTYDPKATEKKINSETQKYPRMGEIGFRILGMQIYKPEENSFQFKDRFFGLSLEPEDVTENGLKLFFTQKSSLRRDVLQLVLSKLGRINEFFHIQREFAFYSSSLLIIYEGDESQSPVESLADVRMIDFTHVFETNEADDNYIYGIGMLIKSLSSLL